MQLHLMAARDQRIRDMMRDTRLDAIDCKTIEGLTELKNRLFEFCAVECCRRSHYEMASETFMFIQDRIREVTLGLH